MNSRIDLTSNRDFDPSKFKVDKVRSRYFDGNSNSCRTPWSKNGNILTDHKISYYSSTSGAGWTLSWVDNIFTNISEEHFYPSTTASTLSDLVTTISTSTSTSSSYFNYTPLTAKTWIQYGPFKSFDYDEFRLGKVGKIRRSFRGLNPGIISTYSKFDRYSDLDVYKKSILNYRKFYKYIDKYYGFDSFAEDCNIGDYRRMNDFVKERSDYILCKIARGSLPKIKDLISKDTRKVKWHDFHEDYLREQMGLRPRRDWLTGESVSQFLAV